MHIEGGGAKLEYRKSFHEVGLREKEEEKEPSLYA